jgi:hypothetical protein
LSGSPGSTHPVSLRFAIGSSGFRGGPHARDGGVASGGVSASGAAASAGGAAATDASSAAVRSPSRGGSASGVAAAVGRSVASGRQAALATSTAISSPDRSASRYGFTRRDDGYAPIVTRPVTIEIPRVESLHSLLLGPAPLSCSPRSRARRRRAFLGRRGSDWVTTGAVAWRCMTHDRRAARRPISTPAWRRLPITSTISAGSSVASGSTRATWRTWPRQPLLGAIDEVAVYDRALTAEQVAALAAGTQPPSAPDGSCGLTRVSAD